jgi:hypothetical protein
MSWKEQLKEIGKMTVTILYKLLKFICEVFDIGGGKGNNNDWTKNTLLDIRFDADGFVAVDAHAVNARVIPILEEHLEAPKFEYFNWTHEGACFFAYSYLDVLDDRYSEDSKLLSNLVTRSLINSYQKSMEFGMPEQLDYYIIADAVSDDESKKIYIVYYAKKGSQAKIESVKNLIG